MAEKRANWGLQSLTLGVYLFLYAPILVLVVFSFNQSRLNAVWQGFTTKWYWAAWNNGAIIQSVRVSLLVAFITTFIATILGTLAALALARYQRTHSLLYNGLFYLPVIIPEIVTGFATVIFLALIGFKLGLTTVIIAHVAFTTSYVVFVVRARLAGMDETLEQAAMDLGANEWQTFYKITLPLLTPGIVSAALLTFTLSLDDYVITSFVAGSSAATLPLQIYSMVKTGITPEINAISTVLLLVTVLLVYFSQRLQQPQPSRATYLCAIIAIAFIGLFALGGGNLQTNERQLNLYIWSNYASPEMLAKFEQRYQVKVRVDIYDSNEALLAKLQTGVVDYDLVVPSDYMISVLLKQQLLRPLDKTQLVNLSNVDRRFLGLPFDPQNQYSVPYTWGTTGIGYRKDKITVAPQSWRVLWDERYRDHISMLDDMREVFAAALKQQGASLNATNPSEIAAAAALLKAQKPLVKTYDSGAFAELLISGDVWLAHGFSGQIGKAMLENPNIGYVIPAEGYTVWTDSICIPRTAPHPELAMLFINYLLEPEVSGQNTNKTGYATPNLAARQFIRPELLANPALFPPDESLRNYEFVRDIGESVEIYDRYWTEIKSN
jgi:spermidine/putrescine transport system permease protein